MSSEQLRYSFSRLYMLNESLFGQSEQQLQKMSQECGIELKINFTNCYLLLTGICKHLYSKRAWMNREQFVTIYHALSAFCKTHGDRLHCHVEVGVMNYDAAKLVVLTLSPDDDAFSIAPVSPDIPEV